MRAKTLRDYTTEELKAELKRRADEKKAAREAIPRCRWCRFWGTVDQYGRPTKLPACVPSSAACPKRRWGRKDLPRFTTASRLACEHFERKDNTTTINTKNDGRNKDDR